MSEFETTTSIPTTSPLERVEASKDTNTHNKRGENKFSKSNRKNKKDSHKISLTKDQVDVSDCQPTIEHKTEKPHDSKIDSKGELIDITV